MDIDELKQLEQMQSRRFMFGRLNLANSRINASAVSADRIEKEFLIESSRRFQNQPKYCVLWLDTNQEKIEERFLNLGDNYVSKIFLDMSSCKTFLDQQIIRSENKVLIISPNSFLTEQDVEILSTMELFAIYCSENNCPQIGILNLKVFFSMDSLYDSLNKILAQDQGLSEAEKFVSFIEIF